MTRRLRILLALLIVVVAIGGGVALALRSPAIVGYWFERQARARFAEFSTRSDFGDDGLHVILCGTASPLPDGNRAKACTMIVAGGRAYVVDTGPESWKQLALTLFPAASSAPTTASSATPGAPAAQRQGWRAGRAGTERSRR